MPDISKFQVQKVVDALGHGLAAEVTGSLPRMPAYWELGQAWPTHQQMVRLKVARNLLDQLTTVMSIEQARDWVARENSVLGTTPAYAIKIGKFDEVRAAARGLKKAKT